MSLVRCPCEVERSACSRARKHTSVPWLNARRKGLFDLPVTICRQRGDEQSSSAGGFAHKPCFRRHSPPPAVRHAPLVPITAHDISSHFVASVVTTQPRNGNSKANSLLTWYGFAARHLRPLLCFCFWQTARQARWLGAELGIVRMGGHKGRMEDVTARAKTSCCPAFPVQQPPPPKNGGS
jgi:hypothetical protein